MKNFDQAIVPAISAGLGAITLRNKMRSLSEAQQTGSEILNFGNSGSFADYKQKPMKKGSGGEGTMDNNASTTKVEGNNGGFAQKIKQNIFQASSESKPTNSSTLVGIPAMPPS